MALFDFLGGAPSGLYGDIFNDTQKSALGQRGLLGFLGGMANSGALDYTMPTITGKMPGGFAKGLAGGMAGMGEAQDAAAMNALKAQLVGLQGSQLKSQIGMQNQFQGMLPGIEKALDDYANAGKAAPGAAPGAAAAPPSNPAAQGGTASLDALGMAQEYVESRGNPNAVSKAGAIGLRQIMPATAADYGVSKDQLFDGETNRKVGNQIMGDLMKKYNGDLDAALVGYNAGPGVADRWLAAGKDPKVLPAETQAYIPAVKAQLAKMQQQARPVQLASAGGDLPQSAVDAATQQPDGGRPLPVPGAPQAATPGAVDMSTIPRAAPGSNISVPGMPGAGVAPAPDPRAAFNAQMLAGAPQNAPAPSGVQMAQAAPQTGIAPQAMAAPMVAGSPQDAARQRLLQRLGLADAAGAALKMGNPFQNLIQVMQGSPEAKAAVAQAEANAKMRGELPLVGPTASAKTGGELQQKLIYDPQIQLAKNIVDQYTKPENFRAGGGGGTMATGPTVAMPILKEVQRADGSTEIIAVNPLTGQRIPSPGQQGAAQSAQPMQGAPASAGSPVDPNQAAKDATNGITAKLSPATEEALKDSGRDDAKLYNDYRAMYLSNQSAKQDLTNAMEALQYVQSGAGAPVTNTIAKALRAMNIDVSSFVNLPQPAQLEIVQKATGRLLGGAVKAVVGGNRPALGEFDYLKNTVVGETTEPEAQRAVAGALLSTMNWQDSLFKDLQEYKKTNHGSPVGFDVSSFGTRNPMPQYYGEAIRSFAPLKGEQPLPQHPDMPGSIEIPAGGKQIGTYQGKPVYQFPDGSRKVQQ